jgi:hypothetical protein
VKVTHNIILAVVAIVAALLIPKFVGVRSKNFAIKIQPGTLTVLRQLHVASVYYWQTHQAPPSSLNDLIGIRVPPSEGPFIPFSRDLLAQELGTNVSALVYTPEFLALTNVGTNAPVVLGYLPEANDPSICHVLYFDGKVKQERISELHAKIGHLRKLLTNEHSAVRAEGP